MEIKPALLERNFKDIEDKLEVISDQADLIQIDMCDGVFVPSKTFGHGADAPSLEVIVGALVRHRKQVEYDLMIHFAENELFFTRWIAFIAMSKPKRAIFHFSSMQEEKWQEIFDQIDERSTDILLAVSLQDDITEVKRLFKEYNFKGIQIMGIMNVGFSGQDLHPKTFIMLDELSEYTDTLLVDGGVKLSNASKLKKHGATSLGITSALFGANDFSSALDEFKNI